MRSELELMLCLAESQKGDTSNRIIARTIEFQFYEIDHTKTRKQKLQLQQILLNQTLSTP